MEYRLNKYISASGFCSRREADRYIEKGKVTIDGKTASVNDRVLPGQKVKVSGNLIETEIKPVYIALNKPVGIVSTANTHESNNIVDFIKHEQRIYPIDSLEKDAQGLILLTNDSSIAKKIANAVHAYKKVYTVTVNKPITPLFISEMKSGVPISGKVTRKCEIREINPYTFQIEIVQEVNKQVSRMCQYLGYEVTKLECIQIMNVNLDKLGQGNWRDLTKNELEIIFNMLDVADNKESKTSEKKQTTIRVGTTIKRKLTDKAKNEDTTGISKEKKQKSKNSKTSKNILKGPREGKSKIKSIKDKTRKRY